MNGLFKEKFKYAVIALFIIIAVTMGALLFLIFNIKRVKNNSELLTELQNSDAFFPYCELTIREFEIIKRKTDKKNKIDTVYVNAVADNADLDITCSLSYEMQYTLYNEGWILENVRRYMDGDWEIPKPSEGIILAELYSQIPYFDANDVHVKFSELIYEDVTPGRMQTEYNIHFSCEEKKETFKAIAKGDFCYVLGEKGWICNLERSNLSNEYTKLIPLVGVGENAAREVLDGIIDDNISETICRSIEEDLENQSARYYFDCYTDYTYLTIIESYQIAYYFDNESAQWINYEATKINEIEDWKIVSHIYEYKLELHKFMGVNQSNILRCVVDSFDGMALKVGIQDNEEGVKAVDGYYERYHSWGVNRTTTPYRYVCGTRLTGLHNYGYVILIDKDYGVYVRRMKFSDDNYYIDAENDDKISNYYHMKQVK